jgi:two-component system, OmpR family, response regulator
MRILLVEDEPEMARLIVEWLNQSGFDADHVATIGKARESIGAHSYSLALLDRRLPDGDGVSLIKDIRRTHPGIRVLMLTALDSVSDKIMGLDAGADD